MHKYKKLTVNIIVLTFILTGGLSTPAYASSILKDKQKDSNREIAILESFEEDNYETWKKYIGKNSNLAKYVSKEKFEKFINVRNLARNGKHDEALTMSEKLEKELTNDLTNVANQDLPQKSLLPVDPRMQKAKDAIDKIKYVKLSALESIK